MALNIKNPETEHLVRELAELAGETQTEAIAVAARERIHRLSRDTRRARLETRAERLQQSVRNSGAPLTTDDLYDDRGLPA